MKTTLYRFERAEKKRAETLCAGQLWASKPKHFNDLTDCRLNLDAFSEPRWEQDRLLAAIRALYPAGVFPEDLPLTGDMFDMLTRQLPPTGTSIKEAAWRAMAQIQLREAIASSVGVCCFFGANLLNPLMWAHYGDNHRGMCVEYEVTIDDPADLHEVEYSSRRPTVTLSEFLFSPWEAVLRVVRTKHLSWAYEQEQRIVSMGKDARESADGFAFPIPHWLRPTRVIVGARVEPSLRVGNERPLKNARSVAAAMGLSLHQVVQDGQDLTAVLREKWSDRGRSILNRAGA